MINKSISNYRWWSLIAFIVIVRLYLTGDRDILATNSPHDEFWYIHTAINKVWCCSYNQMSFMHLPLYSIWLDLLYMFGIPIRLAIDVFWLLAIGYLAFAIRCFTRVTWLAGFVFTFLAFHPYVMVIFDRALAETFLTVISAAVLAAAIELWNCRNEKKTLRSRIAMIVYVFGFAVAFHTRKEGIVLAAPLLLLACWTFFDRQHWWRSNQKPALAISMLLAPLASSFMLGALLSGANYIKYGVWARYELAAPGYERAVAALNSIDVGRTPRQITVTKSMIELGYQESATFRELKPAMDGPTGQQWVAIASAFTPVPGEIGNGWFYWALRDVAAHSGWHATAQVADSKYAAVADELQQAFDAGRLKKKFMLSAFLDPDFSKWMPSLPSSIFNVLQLVVRPPLSSLALPAENAAPTQFDEYVKLTGRRAPPSRIDLGGWIVAPAGSLVGFGDAQSTFAWQRLGNVPRSDVSGAYAFTVSSTGLMAPTELHLLLPGGQTGSVALIALKAGTTSSFTGAALATVGVDSLKSNLSAHRADSWLSILCTGYEWVGYMFCIATIGSIIAMIIQRKHFGIVLLLMLILSAISARVVLFGILDASSWSGIQARYILPIIPFFACMGVLSIASMENLFNKIKVG